jgi:hypothetical protein
MLSTDDHERILARLARVRSDPRHGEAVRQDLAQGFSALPDWMQSVVRELIGAEVGKNPPDRDRDGPSKLQRRAKRPGAHKRPAVDTETHK